MDIRRRYFMTCAALFFLGIVVARPGASFQPKEKERECKMVKGKVVCETKVPDQYFNSNIRYEF